MAATTREKTKLKNQKVISIQSKADFDRVISEAGNKHVLVEFFAKWCGPCAMIAPRLEEFASEYEDCLVIVKIDVDINEDLAEQYDISSMPSFLIIKNKITLESFVGSNGDAVHNALERFCHKDDRMSRPTTSAKAPTRQSKLVTLLKGATAKISPKFTKSETPSKINKK